MPNSSLGPITTVKTIGPVRLEPLPDGRYLIHLETIADDPDAMKNLARHAAQLIRDLDQKRRPSPEESPQPHQP